MYSSPQTHKHGGHMQRFLVFVSLSLLSAGISHAQTPEEILQLALTESKLCSYEAKQAPLDDEGNLKKPLTPTKDGGDTIQKFRDGNKSYWRAIRELHGSFDSTSDNSRSMKATLPQELRYPKWGFILKLQKLDIVLDQVLENDRWLPTFLDITIKYRVGTLGIGLTFHDKYTANINCSAIELVTE